MHQWLAVAQSDGATRDQRISDRMDKLLEDQSADRGDLEGLMKNSLQQMKDGYNSSLDDMV
jgi:hypothetical protein